MVATMVISHSVTVRFTVVGGWGISFSYETLVSCQYASSIRGVQCLFHHEFFPHKMGASTPAHGINFSDCRAQQKGGSLYLRFLLSILSVPCLAASRGIWPNELSNCGNFVRKFVSYRSTTKFPNILRAQDNDTNALGFIYAFGCGYAFTGLQICIRLSILSQSTGDFWVLPRNWIAVTSHYVFFQFVQRNDTCKERMQTSVDHHDMWDLMSRRYNIKFIIKLFAAETRRGGRIKNTRQLYLLLAVNLERPFDPF